MQHISSVTPALKQSRGGRVDSFQLRETHRQCEDFVGLENGSNRFDLLMLVKKAGRDLGFTHKMITLLEYYIMFTKDVDWEEENAPIVYQSLTKTAMDLDISDRQIQRLENALFKIGALTWNDSGNHKRYGQRCSETNRIMYAFGVDLTPLAYLKPDLEAKLHEKRLYQKAWLDKKRQISFYRSQIRSMMAEYEVACEEGRGDVRALRTFKGEYEAIFRQIRSSATLETLISLLKEHKALSERILSAVDISNEEKTQKESSRSEENVAHIQYTNYKPSNKFDTRSPAAQSFQESRSRSSEHQEDDLGQRDCSETDTEPNNQKPEQDDSVLSSGLEHVRPKHLYFAASEEQVVLKAAVTPRFEAWVNVYAVREPLREPIEGQVLLAFNGRTDVSRFSLDVRTGNAGAGRRSRASNPHWKQVAFYGTDGGKTVVP